MSTPTIHGRFNYVESRPDLIVREIQLFQDAVDEALESEGTDEGPVILSADADAVSSNTLTAIETPVMDAQNGLTKNVVSSKLYTFKILLFITAASGEGLQFDFNGGSAGMTWFKAKALGYDGSSQALISPVLTSKSTAFGPQDAFSGWIEMEGSFVPSGDGTFIPRIAQTAHSSGSVQVLKGSKIELL